MHFPWNSRLLPKAHYPDRAEHGLERWQDLAMGDIDPALASFIEETHAAEDGRALLSAIFANSPYLSTCLLREPAVLYRIATDGWKAALDRALDPVRPPPPATATTAQTMTRLRVAKRRAGLVIALADICRVWDVATLTAAISRTARETLHHATAQVLRDTAKMRGLTLPDADDPCRASGLIVIGMGKLGAEELNYSSDIDLIVLYDPEVIDYLDPDRQQKVFVRATRDLARLMEERTADGYVFRTDLRLRPDPGSTPPALSTLAAETYYESLGQNWERAAMIKASAVAGDIDAGTRFLDTLRPFVWRKHLDFIAIQDIHSIKRQINSHRGGSAIAVAGHNVKLGRGGIREIEFFAQTQQLIWGGREPSLRAAPTRTALDALTDFGQVAPGVRDGLITAYDFLRTVEHRLQMIDDQQTQTLPDTEEGLAHLATFMGYDDPGAFGRDLLGHLQTVERHYGELFEEDDSLGAAQGNLVFTGSDDDPDTLRTLRSLGFERPESVSATVRGWHHGRYRATRSRRAREFLTELMPNLLAALGDTANPDRAFNNFDEFLRGLPAGVQLFSLFKSHPPLLSLLAKIAGTAPRLARHLGRNALVLDYVLCREFYQPPDDVAGMTAELSARLDQGKDLQDWLDLSRRWANDLKFQIGVLTLEDTLTPHEAGRALSNVADAAMGALLPRIETLFAERHGRMPGGHMAVLAMGKLGGRELSASSDLDLIFVYDVPEGVEASDGAKPLPPIQYYTRLSHRFINALNAPTGEGVLYEVDMRLRPSGSSGPIACHVSRFEDYQRRDAWTWEHMALTRLRPVFGDPGLLGEIASLARNIIVTPRDPDALVADVAAMRHRIARQHPGRRFWDIKYRPGGLVDLEFLAQYLQLRHGADHEALLSPTTRTVFRQAGRLGLLPDATAAALADAASFWLALQAVLRLTVEGNFNDAEASDDLKALLARAGRCADFTALCAKIDTVGHTVRAAYDTIIDTPAEALAAHRDGPPSSGS